MKPHPPVTIVAMLFDELNPVPCCHKPFFAWFYIVI